MRMIFLKCLGRFRLQNVKNCGRMQEVMSKSDNRVCKHEESPNSKGQDAG